MISFTHRLCALAAERGQLCVGIDPNPQLIAQWGLPVDANGLERCARGLVAAIGDLVCCFKPQSAFFEAFGSAGIVVLEKVLADIKAQGALCILDAKRGDIGSSNEGYVAAYLTDGSPLAADALTMNPYLGLGALEPAFEAAYATGRGIYLLCRTSNPQGPEVQLAQQNHRSVAQYVIDGVKTRNQKNDQDALGLVIGATNESLDIDLSGFNGSILMPGIGAQGGTMADIKRLLGEQATLVLPTTSRGVMKVGPERSVLRAAIAELLAEIEATR